LYDDILRRLKKSIPELYIYNYIYIGEKYKRRINIFKFHIVWFHLNKNQSQYLFSTNYIIPKLLAKLTL